MHSHAAPSLQRCILSQGLPPVQAAQSLLSGPPPVSTAMSTPEPSYSGDAYTQPAAGRSSHFTANHQQNVVAQASQVHFLQEGSDRIVDL